VRGTDYQAHLARLSADPRRPIHELVSLLRADGVHGGQAEMRTAVRAYRAECEGPSLSFVVWVSRETAAKALGVSVKRVDQLRRAGRLESQPGYPGRVEISMRSLDALVATRAAKRARIEARGNR
jgi:hypothetical protein